MDENLKEFLIFMAVGISLVVAWYFYWVIPHDEALSQIMDCMSNTDGSRAAYDYCAQGVER